MHNPFCQHACEYNLGFDRQVVQQQQEACGIHCKQLACNLCLYCRDSDKVSQRTAEVMRNVAELELIQAPTLAFIPPKSYSSLPQLKGTFATCPMGFSQLNCYSDFSL